MSDAESGASGRAIVSWAGHCSRCERTVGVQLPLGPRIRWVRCKQCGTPVPVEKESGDEQ